MELERSEAGVLCGTVDLNHWPSRVRGGRVVDLDGRPVPGAEVVLRETDDDEILTDPDGLYFLDSALDPERPDDPMPAVRLMATSPGGASPPLDVASSKELFQDLPDLVIAPSGGRLSGIVRFANGRPAGGASIVLAHLDEADASEEGEDPAAGRSDWFVLVTDDDGHFETWNAVKGTYEVDETRDGRVTTGVPAELVLEQCRVRFSMTSSDLCASRYRALELFVWKGASAEEAARCFDRGQRPAPCDQRELIEPGESWWGSPGDFVIARPAAPGMQPAVAAHRFTASGPDSTVWFSLSEPDGSTGVSIHVRGPGRDRIERLELQVRDVRCPDMAKARSLTNGGSVALPPGRYDLDVLPAPGSAGEGCSWYAVELAEVVVTPGRVTPVELAVERAARVELSLRSDIDLSRFSFSCGNAYEKKYELSLTSFATGEVIRGFLCGANGDSIGVPGRKGTTLSLRGAHHPGSYRLEFAVGALGSEDLLTLDRTVRLEPGLNKFAFDLTRCRR